MIETSIFLLTQQHNCLEKHIISTHSLAVYFFIVNEAGTFPLTLPLFPNVEHSSHFFVHSLHLSFLRGVQVKPRLHERPSRQRIISQRPSR